MLKLNPKSKPYLLIIFSIALVLAMIFGGIPLIVKITNTLVNLRSVNQPIEIEDTTPPAVPVFNNLSAFTNKSPLLVKGRSEPGVLINFFLNDTQDQTSTDKDGNFSFSLSLKQGENTLSAYALDQSGNESASSEVQTIIYDTTAPEIVIKTPPDGRNYYGELQRQIVIEGATEIGARLIINDRVVVVGSNGTFTYAYSLSEGDNNFELKATDRAGNSTQKGLTLHFWQ